MDCRIKGGEVRIGKVLAAYRQINGISQHRLALDIGITNTALCRLEADDTSVKINAETFLIIMNWLAGDGQQSHTRNLVSDEGGRIARAGDGA